MKPETLARALELLVTMHRALGREACDDAYVSDVCAEIADSLANEPGVDGPALREWAWTSIETDSPSKAPDVIEAIERERQSEAARA